MGWQDAPVVESGKWSAAPEVGAAPAAPKPKMTLWDVVKREARPDLFRMGELAYDAGGQVTDATGSPALGYVTNVAVQALPMLMGGSVGKAAAPALEAGAKTTMQSALKPTLEALRKGDAARAIQTMLDEGINATPGGLRALKSQISTINNEIATAIANSPATVNKGAVAARLNDALKKFEMQVLPSADTAAIQKAWTEFLSHPLLTGRAQIPVQTAQALKQGTYASLGSKAFGELKGAEIEAQKALARGLKEEIAAAVPGVANLNARESALLNAKDILERRVLMQSNNNPIGLGALAESPTGFLAWMADRSPWVKSMIARGLYSGRERIPQAAGMIIGAGANGPQGQ